MSKTQPTKQTAVQPMKRTKWKPRGLWFVRDKKRDKLRKVLSREPSKIHGQWDIEFDHTNACQFCDCRATRTFFVDVLGRDLRPGECEFVPLPVKAKRLKVAS